MNKLRFPNLKKLTQHLALFGVCTVFALSLISSLLGSAISSAAKDPYYWFVKSFEWSDSQTITAKQWQLNPGTGAWSKEAQRGDIKFTRTNSTSNTFTTSWVDNEFGTSCPGTTLTLNNNSLDKAKLAFKWVYKASGGIAATCTSKDFSDVPIHNTQNAKISPAFTWTDKQTISSSGTITSSYKTTNPSPSLQDVFTRTDPAGADCPDTITFAGTDPSQGILTTGRALVSIDNRRDCNAGTKQNISIANSYNSPSGDPTATPDPGGASATCESTGFSFSWIFCPLINGLAASIDGIYGYFVQPLLKTSPVTTNPDTGDKTNTYKIWSNFRIIGDILLVIALLVIIFGQTIGGGAIDAYTTKKVLPRILIAAILINLSIYIVALLVDLTNILGNGITGLLEQPIKDAGAFNIQMSGGTSLIGLGMVALIASIFVGLGAVAVATGGAALLAIVGPLVSFLLLFILLPAFLIFLAILATVIIRNGLILFLIFVSPVAFALYCLPNTEQYFRKWWDLLFKTLLVYPIIAMVFGISKIMSVTINDSGIQSGPGMRFVADIMSILVLIVPLFMIPFAFKIAGGTIARLTGSLDGFRKRSQEFVKGNANDPGSLRNRVRRRAAGAMSEAGLNGSALGTRFNPTTLIGSRRSLRKARLAATRNMYQGLYGKQGTGAAMYEFNKDDSNITGDLAHFSSGAASRAAIDEWYKDEVGKINAAVDRGEFTRGDEIYRARMAAVNATKQQKLFSSAAADKIGRDPAMRRRALLNPATIGYELKPGEEGWNEATSIMRDIAGNDEGTYRSMMNEFQYLAKTAAGRADLAGAVDGGDYNGYRAWGSVGLYQHGNGKPSSITGSSAYFKGLWTRSQNPAQLSPQDIKNFTQHLSESDRSRLGDAGVRVEAQQRAKEAVAIFARELGTLGSNATGATRDEALRQRAELLELAGGEGGPLAVVAASERVKAAVRGYDPQEAERRRLADPGA